MTNKTQIKYDFDIGVRPERLGGGWQLRLIENDIEVGGGVFPAPAAPAQEVELWLAGLNEQQRAYWREVSCSDEATRWHRAYLLEEAYNDAESTAYEWLDSRGEHDR